MGSGSGLRQNHRPLDPTTFALVTVVLAVTAALSIVGPAWRPARIDPAAALRNR